MAKELFLGLMCGTSVDSVDAALVDFGGSSFELLATHSGVIPSSLRQAIFALCESGPDEIERMGVVDRQVARLFAQTALELLNNANIGSEDVTAIGSHGQTIRHRPLNASRATAFTLQIGDPSTIAELTGITTVADFRRRDIAAGGQGAPLVPPFHQASFAKQGKNVAIINIGGMANVSLLHSSGELSGFDTGPGNVLMDAWIKQQLGRDYDADGGWGSSGQCIPELMDQLLRHPFLALTPPKSTGREEFNLDWLNDQLAQLGGDYPDADIQATLAAFTVASISDALAGQDLAEVLVCGGGALNPQLMGGLAGAMSPIAVKSTQSAGLDPEWVEACAFAWLARQTLKGFTGNAPGVTGASAARILGGIYQA